MMEVNKFISASGVILEAGDLYGGGPEEVIEHLELEGGLLTVRTSTSSYDLSLAPGDYLGFSDGSSRIIKSKYDEEGL